MAENPKKGRILFLMTPHSVRRPDGFCLNELAWALNRRLHVVPVMLVWCEPPLSICRLQWLDMQDCIPLRAQEQRYTARYPELLAALKRRPDRAEETSRLLDVLQPLPFEADSLLHLPRFTGREWLIRQIDRWLDKPDESRIYWLVGDPGVGKTALAAWLCWRHPRIAAFHLCSHGHTLKADPRRCFMSLAYQLATQLKDYQARLDDLDLEQIVPQSNATALFDMLLVQPFARDFPRPAQPVVLLIDALDEASQGDRNEIAEVVVREFRRTPAWLRLIVTSRPEPSVTVPFQELTRHPLERSSPGNQQDLRDFLARELRGPAAPGQSVPAPVIETILRQSGGIFLYAELVRREVKEGRLSFDHPEHFPQGLGGAFYEAFRRQFSDLDVYKKTVRPVLEVVLAAHGVMLPETLAAVLGWDAYELDDICTKLGALFPAGADGIRPFHGALAEWVTDVSTAGRYRVSIQQGHKRLAACGWGQYESGVANVSSYFLSALPLHLAAVRRWEPLGRFLSDPTLIEARCKSHLAYDMIRDLALLGQLGQPLQPVVESLVHVFKDRLLEPMRQQLRSALNQFFGPYDTWPLPLRQKLEQSTDLTLVLFLGDTLDMEERFDRAEAIYRQLWETAAPTHPREYATACARLTEVLEHQDRPQEGLAIADRFNARPDLRERCGSVYYWWVQYQRAICLRRLHRYDEAVALLEEVGAAEAGHQVSALHQRGVIDLEVNRLAEAQTKFELGLKRRPGHKWNHRRAFEHRRIGQIHALSGRATAAREALEQALTISVNCGNQRYATQVRRDFVTFLELPEALRGQDADILHGEKLAQEFHVTEPELRMAFRVLWHQGRGYLPVISPETGMPTGEAVRWEVAHTQGHWHATVMVLIFDPDGHLALQERHESDSRGRLDVSVSGHAEIGEPDILAAIRETAEETGLITGAGSLVRVGKSLQWIKEGSPDTPAETYESRYRYHYPTLKVNRERMSVFALRVANRAQLQARGMHWHPLPDAVRMARQQPARFASAFKQLLYDQTLGELREMLGSGKV
ncbi:MAG: NUDIX domain-containing protein [Planctomycetes bacterium]|nr:NUDIX domain-containing protein [Planctomycetota bacterium]